MTRLFRSIASLLLCGTLLVVTAPVGASAEKDTVQTISTKEELNQIRQNPSGKYRLTANIAFLPEDFAPGGAFYNNGAGWQPIGNSYSTRFTGELDGNGHTIDGLTVTLSAPTSESSIYAGLFGYAGGRIENLRMTNTTISVTGGQYVYAGSLVAAGMGTIRACEIENSRIVLTETALTGKAGGIAGRMFSGAIRMCRMSGSIEAQGVAPSVGGLVGQSPAAIEESYCKASIVMQSSSDSYAGGITGVNEGSIKSAVTDADLRITSQSDCDVGGIAGWNQSTIAASLATGKQTRKVLKHDNYGGICGVGSSGGTGTVLQCYFALDAFVDKEIPAVEGATGLTAAQLNEAESFENWDFASDWCIGLEAGVAYPLPQSIVRRHMRRSLDEMVQHMSTQDSLWYTDASWNALGKAVQDAKALTDNDTVYAYSDALKTLDNANSGLVKKSLGYAVQGDGQVKITGENTLGSTVTLSATAGSEQQFAGFVIRGVWYTDSETDVLVNGNEHITAYFRPKNACTVVFRGKYGKVLSVQTVTSVDDLIPPTAENLRGYAFSGWSTDLKELDLSAGQISVDAVYTATEETGYTITLIDATTQQTIDQPLAFDTRVDVQPVAKEDFIFSYWLVNGAVASYSTNYTLYVAGNDTVQAVYNDDGSSKPVVSLQQTTVQSSSNGNYTLSAIGQICAPENVTVLEYGVLFGADSTFADTPDALTLGSLAFPTQAVSASSATPDRRYLIHLRQVPPDSTRFTRAYAIVRDASGQIMVLYSAVEAVNIPS